MVVERVIDSLVVGFELRKTVKIFKTCSRSCHVGGFLGPVKHTLEWSHLLRIWREIQSAFPFTDFLCVGHVLYLVIENYLGRLHLAGDHRQESADIEIIEFGVHDEILLGKIIVYVQKLQREQLALTEVADC